MRCLLTLLFILALSLTATASTDLSGPMGHSLGFSGRFPIAGGMGAGVTVPCVPGAPTGQMDFSVCSNIAITAALP